MIKKECAIKSLKNDYSDIALIAVPITVLCLLAYICVTYHTQLENFDKMISSIIEGYFSYIGAVNFFIISEISVILFISAFVICLARADNDDKEFTKYMKLPDATFKFILVNIIVMSFAFTIYHIQSYASEVPYPNVTNLFIGLLAISSLIISPLVVAYVRCRE